MNKRRLLFSLVMAVALIITFVPTPGSEALAASKPAKAKITSFKQAATTKTAGQYKITAKWNAAKNAKKYKIVLKEDGVKIKTKTVSKKTRSFSYAAGKIGSKYTVSVQSLNGKKAAKAASKNLTVKDKRAEVKSVQIQAASMTVGSELKAVLDPSAAAADATFTWFQVGSTAPVGTGASYVAKDSDVGKQLTVTAAIAGSLAYQDASLTDVTTGVVIEKPKADFYAAEVPVVAGSTAHATVVTNPALTPDADSVEYTWREDGNIVLKNKTASSYAQNTVGVVLTCTVNYKVDGADKEIIVNFGKVAKAVSDDYKLEVKDSKSTETTTLAAGETLTASVVSKTEAAAPYAGDVAYEWSYVNKDGEKVVLSKTASLKGDSNVIGKGITSISLAVLVTPTEENNYSGTFTATIIPGNDIVDTIALGGDAVVDGTLTATVTGVAGSDMSKTAITGWQVYNPGTDSWSEIVPEAVGNDTYKVASTYYGKDVRAKAQVSAGVYKYTDKVTIGKKEISGVELKWQDGSVYNDVTIGKPVIAVIDPADASSIVDVTYYASTVKADVENCAEAAKLTAAPASADADMYYGAKIALKSGVEYATIAKDMAPVVKPVEEKSPAIADTAVSITAKNGATDVTLNSTTILKEGYTLTAAVDPSAYKTGEKLTYQWFRNTNKNPAGEATENASYTLTKEDAGKNQIGVKVFCEGHYDPIAVQKWLVKGTDFAEIEEADKTMDAKATFSTKVGGKCVVTGAPEGATYTWTATSIADPTLTFQLTPASGDATGECTIPATAYEHKIKVIVAKAGYTTYEATQSTYVSDTAKANLTMTSSNPIMENKDGSEYLTVTLDKAEAQKSSAYTWKLVKADKTTVATSGTTGNTYSALHSASVGEYMYVYAEVEVVSGYGGGFVKSDKMAVYDKDKDEWTLQDNIF